MDLLLTVDRFEEGTAVLLVRPCEDRAILWPVADLPPGCKEGDILRITVEVSQSETEAARQRVESLSSAAQQGPDRPAGSRRQDQSPQT